MPRILKVVIIFVSGLLLYSVAAMMAVGSTVPYHFIKSGHPIDMILNDGGRWFYYYEGGSVKELASTVRNELLPVGFNEDSSHLPWFHFVNGDREVIVCEHSQIMTTTDIKGHTSLAVSPAMPFPKGYNPKDHAVVWVRDRGGSKFQLVCFRIKKTVLFW